MDGTGCRLPNEEWLGAALGWHENQHGRVPSTRFLILFDVLHQILVDVQLHARTMAEVTIAAPLIETLPTDVLALYDRGFGSSAIPYLPLRYGSHCVIRLRTGFNPAVVDFVQSREKERLVTSCLSEGAARSLRRLGYVVSRKEPIPYRLIRVDLPGGEVEVLLTTLTHRQRYPYRHFGALYRQRWGVETAIFVLKNEFQAAVFARYTLPAVAQEIWALFAMYNLQSILIRAQQRELNQIRQGRQYACPINRNVTIGWIKRHLPDLFLDEVKSWYARLKALHKEMIRYLEPIRPRPARMRKSRGMRSPERHYYEPNYKPTL